MAENFPDRAPSASELAEMAQLWKQDVPTLSDPQPLYAAALLARNQAIDRGDPRLIEEAETRLADIRATYPGIETE